jgi:putative drug exporter of the RND superfamily
LVQLSILSDADVDPVLPLLRAADHRQAFEVSITGLRTLNHDFTKLSQDDLSHGELRFGLPAAFVVLLLVFGAGAL